MRRWFAPLAIALLCASGSVRAAQTLSFVQLITTAPQGAEAVYDFSFTTDRNDFTFARVYFNLNDGVRYGCGVFANARCTLHGAGQALKLVGLADGIQGVFSWVQDPLVDNRPTAISIGVPLPAADLQFFDIRISQQIDLPEPSAWTLMIGGFGLLGLRLRRRPRKAALDQRSWLSLLPRRLMPVLTIVASRADWHCTHVRVPGNAKRRRAGMSSPHSSHCSAPSPLGSRARALRTASVTVSSI